MKTFTNIQNVMYLFENRGRRGCDASLILHPWFSLPEGAVGEQVFWVPPWFLSSAGMKEWGMEIWKEELPYRVVGNVRWNAHRAPSPDMSSHPHSVSTYDDAHVTWTWMWQKHMPFGHQPPGHRGFLDPSSGPRVPFCSIRTTTLLLGTAFLEPRSSP